MTIHHLMARAKLCLALAIAAFAVGCANSETSTTAVTPEIVLAYAHSTDYSSYTLDWIEKNGESFSVQSSKLTLSASGLRSPTPVGNYLLVVDSSNPGRLMAYDRATMTVAGQINVGSYPQDMVVVNSVAYIANGAFGTNVVKRIDVSNLPSMTALSDITVGNQPSVVRYYNNRIYVGNQDWNNRIQATVSVINPATNSVEATFNTGPNNYDIAYDGTRIWTYNADWYDGSFTCQNNASLTYVSAATHTSPANITPPTGYNTSSNCSKSGFAFNSTGGFVALRHSSGAFHLFSINGATLNNTPVDSTNRYVFVGNGSQYLYKIHNGDGSTNVLTVRVENLSGTALATLQLTKDTDMYFHVVK